MMLNSFDILLLCLRVEAKKRKNRDKRVIPALNVAQRPLRDPWRSGSGRDIFSITKWPSLPELLRHAGHRRLPDLERRRDVHHQNA